MDVDVDAAAVGARDGHHGETATSTSTSWGDLPTDARARVISHLAPHDMIVAAAAVGDRVAELAASIATTETLFDAEIPLLARRISKDAVALLPGETWLSCWAAVSAVFQGIVTKPGEARAVPDRTSRRHRQNAGANAAALSVALAFLFSDDARVADDSGARQTDWISWFVPAYAHHLMKIMTSDYDDWEKSAREQEEILKQAAVMKQAKSRVRVVARRLAREGLFDAAAEILLSARLHPLFPSFMRDMRDERGDDDADRVDISTYLVDRLYASTYVRDDGDDARDLVLATAFSARAVANAQSRMPGYSPGYPAGSTRSLKKLGRALRAHARALALAAQHVAIGAMDEYEFKRMPWSPLGVWPEYRDPVRFGGDDADVVQNERKLNEILGPILRMDDAAIAERVAAGPNEDEDSEDFDVRPLCRGQILAEHSTSERPRQHFEWGRWETQYVRFYEASAAAANARLAWKLVGDEREIAIAIAVQAEVAYCEACAQVRVYGGVHGHQTSAGIIIVLLTVATATTLFRKALRRFEAAGLGDSVDAATATKDLGKTLSFAGHILEQLQPRVAAFAFRRDPTEWNASEEANQLSTRAKTLFENALGATHPMTLNARRLCGESVAEDDDPNVKAGDVARDIAAKQMCNGLKRRDQRGDAIDGDEEDEVDDEDYYHSAHTTSSPEASDDEE